MSTKKKILFVENRHKTMFWSKVSQNLDREFFETYFIIQNKMFSPKVDKNIICLGFPGKEDMAISKPNLPDDLLEYLQARDRGYKYFNSGSDHYGYYYLKIKNLLELIKPDLVIGESTLFHELITIYLCNQLNITFIHPTGSRYPSGRFQLFLGDTQNVAASSGESWERHRIDTFLNKIKDGRLQPEYMIKAKSKYKLARFKVYRVLMWLKVFVGRLLGEKFNTPSFRKKMALQLRLNACIKKWDRESSLPEGKKNILYLMQMQPEANLDVWGADFSDQVALVKTIASSLPSDSNLIIKINPKTKYEVFHLSDDTASFNNIYYAPRTSTVSSLLPYVAGIITVTGTIGLESVFKTQNCISLRHPALRKICPAVTSHSVQDAITKIFTGVSRFNEGDIASDLLESLVSDSFDGTIGDPLYSPHAFSNSNISKVVKALESCLS